jgi:uncharacterized OB-fold protein
MSHKQNDVIGEMVKENPKCPHCGAFLEDPRGFCEHCQEQDALGEAEAEAKAKAEAEYMAQMEWEAQAEAESHYEPEEGI